MTKAIRYILSKINKVPSGETEKLLLEASEMFNLNSVQKEYIFRRFIGH
ncbi:MAG TPA: hypothetical protein PLA54_08050 [Spirochaetota bacterium]|nr:hypothetical protein [Spirochaetota bacterium]